MAIIVAVATVVAIANWRDVQRSKRPHTSGSLLGSPGAPGTSRADLEARVRDMESRVAKNPDDAGAAVLLADALMRQTRVTGNVGLAVRAESVLQRVLVDNPGNYDANRMLATLYLSEHRFRDALATAEKTRADRPSDPINYGIIGDAHLELGEYDEAFAAFDEMMTRRPSAAAYARVAYARELQGNLDGAIEVMKLAADATSPTDPEGLAWTRAQLGDLYFQRGRLNDAKAAYAQASQAFPGHPFAVIGYAKVIAAEGDRVGAINLLAGLAETSPTPDLFARIGDLYAQLGHRDEAERQYALAEAAWRTDAPEPKNLARFLADHDRNLNDAVAIAERAARERHDIFTEDALAIAYFKTGRVDEARRAIAQALRTGTRDQSIRAHAKAISGV
ncbi:MAG TPA: tetratricopeptide repeat protein [Vicinamibacterales bacterium]|nr:tetratricopeptide repeat protein [Vicinamibacterales bacterium]